MRRDESTGPGEQGTERVALYVLTTSQRVWIVLGLPDSFSLAPKQLLLFFYSSTILDGGGCCGGGAGGAGDGGDDDDDDVSISFHRHIKTK